jgi:hypothetical protein
MIYMPKIGRYRPVTGGKVGLNHIPCWGREGRIGEKAIRKKIHRTCFLFLPDKLPSGHARIMSEIFGNRVNHPVSITVSTNVVSWVMSIGSSPFSTARKTPEISMRRSLLVTKWMNLEMLGEER